ncbi:MAG: NCS2 family permease [Actinomycetia bacterium]|nr:NCS2 family permease [Actinomycetes bacterium]
MPAATRPPADAKKTAANKSAERSTAPIGPLDRFFEITKRGSTITREVRGGFVTFFAMCYIIVLNPLILSTAPAANGKFITGASANGPSVTAVAATALVAGVMSILMGLIANFPMAMAAGLGVNSVVTFTIAQQSGMSFADAMGVVVIAGLIIFVLVMTGFRQAVFNAVPHALKLAISVGIGLFIAFIGFANAGFSMPGAGTPVQLGTGGSLATWPVFVFVIGLLLTIVLVSRKVKGGILIAIVVTTILAAIVQAIGNFGARYDPGGGKPVINPDGWQLNVPTLDGGKVAGKPDFSILGHFSISGAWVHLGVITFIMMVFTVFLSDFFDLMGTSVAIGAEAGLLDEKGMPARTREILAIDALGAVAGGAGGISSNTGFIESASGVGDGARTGLSTIVTGICFLLATFFAPLVEAVPYEAAAPALVVVGFLMMMQVRSINWEDFEVAIPAFLTIVVMPFTYSITNGIGAGFISFLVIKAARGKFKEIHWLMWLVSILFVIYFAFDPIKNALHG